MYVYVYIYAHTYTYINLIYFSKAWRQARGGDRTLKGSRKEQTLAASIYI